MAPARVCIDVGEEIGCPVCGAAAGRKCLPEVLYIGHSCILAPGRHVGVDDIACVSRSELPTPTLYIAS